MENIRSLSKDYWVFAYIHWPPSNITQSSEWWFFYAVSWRGAKTDGTGSNVSGAGGRYPGELWGLIILHSMRHTVQSISLLEP